ncbi:hypothetical protein AA0117_g12866 [Alternaria alternata]|uniref:Uncharacterized protein n=1 Tax=Alternaria alternata TaxID=5599 RepID=A0A4Q4MY53_ALTAL|nr:hypothetical protein AA0117_g12866 [Alternaria alternata]
MRAPLLAVHCQSDAVVIVHLSLFLLDHLSRQGLKVLWIGDRDNRLIRAQDCDLVVERTREGCQEVGVNQPRWQTVACINRDQFLLYLYQLVAKLANAPSVSERGAQELFEQRPDDRASPLAVTLAQE